MYGSRQHPPPPSVRALPARPLQSTSRLQLVGGRQRARKPARARGLRGHAQIGPMGRQGGQASTMAREPNGVAAQQLKPQFYKIQRVGEALSQRRGAHCSRGFSRPRRRTLAGVWLAPLAGRSHKNTRNPGAKGQSCFRRRRGPRAKGTHRHTGSKPNTTPTGHGTYIHSTNTR